MSNELAIYEAEIKKFELEHKKAEALCASAFFPQSLQTNGNGLANAVIIYELASRMQISPFEVAQSIFIIKGKPSFETKFLVARLNQSGKLKGRLRTIINEAKTEAYCEAIEAETGEILRGTTITLDIAKKEGWLEKSGSKWQTIPELMLRYRAQSFFINEYFPEVKFGLKTTDEAEDIVEAKFTQNNSFKTQNENEVIENIDLNQIALNKPLKEQEKAEAEKVADETKQKTFKFGYVGDKLALFQFLTGEKGLIDDEAIGLIQQFAPTGTLAKALLENSERLENAISEYFKG